MNYLKNPLVIVGAIALIILAILFWNYTETIKEKNTIEREKIASQERIKTVELKQEQEQMEAKYLQEQRVAETKLQGQASTEKQAAAQRLRNELLKIQAGFIVACTSKYETVRQDLLSTPSAIIIRMKEFADKRCEGGDYFDPNSYWFCENGKPYGHDEESYVSRCVSRRMLQL
ncbi:MAG: hypothetical protein Q7N87_01265 [Candidatus Uhrbacteria bacterium]|nr:hypothetical protein [Candidatus Uhrbacteria bacterium]